MFNHGITFGGHPVSCAVALKNLEVMEREGVLENVRQNEDDIARLSSQKLGEKPIVGDVRGAGYFDVARAGQGQGDEGSIHGRRGGVPVPGLPLAARLRRRLDLPRRRPRRPGDPASRRRSSQRATTWTSSTTSSTPCSTKAWVEMTKSGSRQTVSSSAWGSVAVLGAAGIIGPAIVATLAGTTRRSASSPRHERASRRGGGPPRRRQGLRRALDIRDGEPPRGARRTRRVREHGLLPDQPLMRWRRRLPPARLRRPRRLFHVTRSSSAWTRFRDAGLLAVLGMGWRRARPT